MKRSAIFSTLLFICLTATGTALGQEPEACQFNIIGTWSASAPGAKNPILFRFTPDGKVTALAPAAADPSAALKEIASATYELDNPKAPKSIVFTATNKGQVFAYGKNSMKIIKYDDASFTCMKAGARPARWAKVDPHRYFLVLAARHGEFYDTSGSAFQMLIKMVGRETQMDAVGTYNDDGKIAFGRVPPDAYKDFMREPRTESEVMLRLEINSAQYERGLKILRTWERRVQEGATLYMDSRLNNVLVVKAVTEQLNQCNQDIKLYKLSYLVHEDWIADKYAPPFIPFALFKELRRLNESLHVRDDKFQQPSLASGLPSKASSESPPN